MILHSTDKPIANSANTAAFQHLAGLDILRQPADLLSPVLVIDDQITRMRGLTHNRNRATLRGFTVMPLRSRMALSLAQQGVIGFAAILVFRPLVPGEHHARHNRQSDQQRGKALFIAPRFAHRSATGRPYHRSSSFPTPIRTVPGFAGDHHRPAERFDGQGSSLGDEMSQGTQCAVRHGKAT